MFGLNEQEITLTKDPISWKKDFKPFLKSPTVGNSDLVTRWEALQTRQFFYQVNLFNLAKLMAECNEWIIYNTIKYFAVFIAIIGIVIALVRSFRIKSAQ